MFQPRRVAVVGASEKRGSIATPIHTVHDIVHRNLLAEALLWILQVHLEGPSLVQELCLSLPGNCKFDNHCQTNTAFKGIKEVI
jgi:hypothetical protein